jgi:hypothetical protein
LNICVEELVAGHFPYHVKTFQGNLPTPFPGSVLLAIPFVLAGTSAYQNFFWLSVFFWRFCVYFGDPRRALLICGTMLCLSPVMMWEILSGSDLLSNNLFVLISVFEVIRRIPDQTQPLWKKILVSLFLGVSLSSRPTFFGYLPLVAAYLAKKTDLLHACKYVGLIGLAFFSITLPFYLFDPAGFTPAHTGNIFWSLNTLFPAAASIIFVTLILATLAAMWIIYRNPGCVFTCMAGLQALSFGWMLVLVLHSGPINIPVFNNQGIEYLVVPYYHMIGYGVNMQVPGLFAFFMAKYAEEVKSSYV